MGGVVTGGGTAGDAPTTRAQRDRRLLAWLGAGLLAGGIPTHEVEQDLRGLATTLGHPRAQVACLPRGVWVTLSAGRPATFEGVEGGLRLEQLADCTALLAGLSAPQVQDLRARFVSFGCCGVTDPIGDLVALGLVEEVPA